MELILQDGTSNVKIQKELSYICMKMQEVFLPLISDIGARIQFVKYLTTFTNSDVILVAYRGYSDSEGEPS